MVAKRNVLNLLSIGLAQELGHILVVRRARAGQIVRLVAMILAIQKYDNGRISNIIWTDVIDSHAIAGCDEFALLLEQSPLMQQGRRHEMRRAQDRKGHL